MRWWLTSEGLGPDYCKDCNAKPNAFTPCEKCPRPEILPENKDAITLFIKSDTQWRYADGMKPVLDYVAVKYVADALDITWNKEILNSINVLETAAVDKRIENMKAKSGDA